MGRPRPLKISKKRFHRSRTCPSDKKYWIERRVSSDQRHPNMAGNRIGPQEDNVRKYHQFVNKIYKVIRDDISHPPHIEQDYRNFYYKKDRPEPRLIGSGKLQT